jgi:cyclopropane-fatty-acyl-phospholipid synthase
MALSLTKDPHSLKARALLLDLLSRLPGYPFAVRLPNDDVIPPNPPHQLPSFTLVLQRPAALRRMLLPPSELGIGESYIFGDCDIEGDIVAAFAFVDQSPWPQLSLGEWARLGWGLWQLEQAGRLRPEFTLEPGGHFASFTANGRLHSPNRDRTAIQFHYDLSNNFYKLWLDQRLVYSCAYFATVDESLESAQQRKLDRICLKLNLQPGERFLDIGCGWGGLLIHAATQYGVEAVGITLSEEQTAEARARIDAAGLADRCRIRICHYQQFETEPLDKIASVGMFEHVGREKLVAYFTKARQLLKPGGLFLLQGGSARIDRRHVGRSWMDRLNLGRNAFMQKYSFPDSWLIDLPTILATAEKAGFETRDVESLREHYPLTLRHWLTRLEQNQEKAIAEVGEVAYRCWRLVLAGYLYLLERGQLVEYQTLLRK